MDFSLCRGRLFVTAAFLPILAACGSNLPVTNNHSPEEEPPVKSTTSGDSAKSDKTTPPDSNNKATVQTTRHPAGSAQKTTIIRSDAPPAKAGSCTHEGNGTDYPVGPGKKYSNLSEIPWESLRPGDTVRIFWRDTPYREKILIRTKGTRKQPIRICGVAGANGERPVISGEKATTRPRFDNMDNYFSRDHDNFQGLGLIILSGNYNEKPANIIIEGLHLQRARKEYSFTNTRGERKNYGDGAACIRLQAADNVVIRNNEISHCGNGIFTMSQGYNDANLTRNILIEGNYLHNNGQPGSYRQHNLYIQAIGAVFQYNRFGPNTPGAEGANLKDRSAGTIIRYNWFEGGTRTMDLVEVEDSASWFIEQVYLDSLEGSAPDPERLADVRRTEALYRKTYVYGNLVLNAGSDASPNLVHYGFDNDPELARKGTLYFYNNTLVMRHDREKQWRARVFDVSLYDERKGTPGEEVIEAFNNIIYLESETPGATPSYLCLGRESGTINLGINWITSSWNNTETFSECYPYETKPVFNGVKNLLDTSDAPLPVNIKTFVPNNIPTIRTPGQPLPSVVIHSHPVKYQYVLHQKGKPRPSMNYLGAMEQP